MPAGEFNAGYSFLDQGQSTFNEHGFQIGLTANANPWFAVEGQFDAWISGDHDAYAITGGPRFSWRTRHVTPYVHFLVGGVISRLAGNTEGDFALKYGLGVDIAITRHFSWRVEGNDVVLVRPEKHYFQLSTGMVYRWY